jgi:hypothetical protein
MVAGIASLFLTLTGVIVANMFLTMMVVEINRRRQEGPLSRISHHLTTQTGRCVLRRAAYRVRQMGGKLTLCAAGLKPRAG